MKQMIKVSEDELNDFLSNDTSSPPAKKMKECFRHHE